MLPARPWEVAGIPTRRPETPAREQRPINYSPRSLLCVPAFSSRPSRLGRQWMAQSRCAALRDLAGDYRLCQETGLTGNRSFCTQGFKGGLFGIHTCCTHYRPSIWMIQSITSAVRSFLLHESALLFDMPAPPHDASAECDQIARIEAPV